MKLSELKETVIAIRGKEEWEYFKETYGYKVYIATEEEQLVLIKQNPFAIKFINNPSEKLQLKSVKHEDIDILCSNHCINNPTDEVLKYLIKNNYSLEMLRYLLRYIEKD